MWKLLSRILGQRSDVEQCADERRIAIEKTILDDDWLLYCAQDADSKTYGMDFDTWWSLAQFSDDIILRFAKAMPQEKLPSKNEIGKILLEIVRCGKHQVYLAPRPPDANITGGSILVKRNR